MKISVLVPVYKVENYIEKCAESILSQSYNDLEIIFVDDCSPDNSVEILKRVIEKYPNRKQQIHLLRHKKNQGLCVTRKTAIDYATGDYVLCVDSDDYLEENAIECFVKKTENGTVDMVFGDFINVYVNKSYLYKRRVVSSVPEMICRIIERKDYCSVVNALIRKDLYNDLEIININNAEDYLTTPRLLYNAKKISFTEIPTYNYTHFNENATQFNLADKKNIEDEKKSIDYLEHFFANKRDNERYMRSLNVGYITHSCKKIIYSKTVSELKKIKISKEKLNKYSYKEQKKTYKVLLVLFKLKLYHLIIIMNKIFYQLNKYKMARQ